MTCHVAAWYIINMQKGRSMLCFVSTKGIDSNKLDTQEIVHTKISFPMYKKS
jgi:hypothetical protein